MTSCSCCHSLLQLLDELLKEEHVMDVIGCLEYDPDLTATQQHRQFLSSAVVFKEVVPITSQDVLAKIHQTYRIQYLKDVILPRRCGWQPVSGFKLGVNVVGGCGGRRVTCSWVTMTPCFVPCAPDGWLLLLLLLQPG